jgi:membrane protein implicated in regulation of membrane protease activity
MEFFMWIWLGIFIVALFLEFATSDMVSIWFALAAVPSFILALFNVHVVVQIVLFVVVAILLLVLTRPVVMKYFKTNEIKTNVDAVIGTTATVIAKITPDTIGLVKIRSTDWSAISHQTIEVGEKVRILDVEGVKLIVEKI